MLFSIIMCTYNSAKSLKYAVDSVRNQVFDEWELIILDNGSEDETVSLLKVYEKTDNRIKCKYFEKNIGWCAGISLCLDCAQGEYMMFLGADDCISTCDSLEEVAVEIEKERPDIVWTGCTFANFIDGEHRFYHNIIPEYKIYTGCSICDIAEIMKNTYYNSVMHYVNINFLKENNIDFFDPYYGDCQGMMKALCMAKKMVVLDKTEYILTVNTSQTVLAVEYDYDMIKQWSCIKDILSYSETDEKVIQYIARRIMKNIEPMLEGILMKYPLRDRYMNKIEKDDADRFIKVEKWLSNDVFGEMLYYAGREYYSEKILCAAGIIYWDCQKNRFLSEKIKSNSKWLAKFVCNFFRMDEQENLTINNESSAKVWEAVNSLDNPNKIGREIARKYI